jgi:hypothetical protein
MICPNCQEKTERENVGGGVYYELCACGWHSPLIYSQGNLALVMSSSAFAERTPPSCALPGLSAVLAPGGK